MSEGQPRFSLRMLLLAVTVCAALLGGYLWIARVAREADRQAVRSAYEHGRLTREQAIDNGLSPSDPIFRQSSD
jgi:hypothetical protein